jgi:hypothetical protein
MKMYTIGAIHSIGRTSEYATSFWEDRGYRYAKKCPFCKSSMRNSGGFLTAALFKAIIYSPHLCNRIRTGQKEEHQEEITDGDV